MEKIRIQIRPMVIVGLALFAVGGYWARAADLPPEPLFKEANDAYQKGDYAAARESYEKIVSQGLGSPSLYFNLGNTFHRLKRLGPARLWYERALAETPGDGDIRFNLATLRSQLEEDTPGFLEELSLRAPILMAAALLFNFLFFCFLGVSLFRETEALWWARWISGFALLAVFGIAVAAGVSLSQDHGVVLSRAEARAGPNDQEPVGFVVPEGRRVALFQSVNGWTAIGLPEKGLKGWVPDNTVEPIHRAPADHSH